MKQSLSTGLPALVAAALLFAISGCAGSKGSARFPTPEERYADALAKFENHDYQEAIDQLQLVTLQYGGSSVADSAQYLLGECQYAKGQYLLSAYEYDKLIRNMPSSRLVPLARYKLGMCYYDLSPKQALDQKYTYKAIDELQAFVEYNPTNELVPEAEKRIHELNNKLAEKNLTTAVLYMKLGDYRAAGIYFDQVLERYHDSDVTDQAAKGKIESLIARKRYEAAALEIQHFIERYPKSRFLPDVEALKAQVKHEQPESPESAASAVQPSNGERQ